MVKEKILGEEDYQESITNNSAIEIGVFGSFFDRTQDLTRYLYQNMLTLFKTVDGKQTIQAGDKKEIILSRDDIPYTLLSMYPKNLFPIDCTTIDNMPNDSPPIVISKDSVDQFQLAVQFVIHIYTFPTSTLANEYVIKLQEFSDAQDPNSKIINDWLQTTKKFQNLVFSSILTATSYINTYPVNFLGGQEKKTYYMYQCSSTGSTKYIGDVVIERTSNLFPITDSNKLFSISCMLIGKEPVSLIYGEHQFSNEEGTYALNGLYIQRNMLTGEASDNKIIPILAGMINGVKVIGTTEKMDDWFTRNQRSSEDHWVLYVEIAGVLLGILALMVIPMFIYFYYETLSALWVKFKQDVQNLRDAFREKLGQSGSYDFPETNDKLTQILEQVKNRQIQFRLDQVLDKAKEGLSKTLETTKALIEKVGPDKQMEGLELDLNQKLKLVNSAAIDFMDGEITEAQYKEAVDTFRSQIEEPIKKMNTWQEQTAKTLGESAMTSVKQSQEFQEECAIKAGEMRALEEEETEGKLAEDEWNEEDLIGKDF